MTADLTAAQERAVRLALAAGRYRRRAEAAEATLNRIRALADYWDNWGKPHAEELRRALNEGPTKS